MGLSKILAFCLLGLASAAATAASSSPRDVVSFDFGWKHRPGLHDWADPDAPPPANPDPGAAPKEAAPAYKDGDWKSVQLPHDGLISFQASEKACPDGCSGRSYIPRHVLWYRKKFTIPKTWDGSAYWLDFAGSFRETTVWVNGVLSAKHVCGYTPFRLRLDNITAVKVGEETTVAVFVDPDNGDTGGQDHGSGWWYEGGGLYREVNLVRANPLHIEQDGLFAYSNLTGVKNSRLAAASTTLLSQPTAASGVVHAKATVVNTATAPTSACVTFALTAADGSSAAAQNSSTISVPAGATATAKASLSVASPRLWTSSTPTLYTVTASVSSGSCSAAATAQRKLASSSSPAVLDAVSVVHGFRSLRYDANDGFFLNEDHFKVRGFCDHNNFAVVGMAVPQRINLFRAQASRAVGGNGRRTSHNPPDTSMLDIYDRVGVVVMDENRLFDNKTEFVQNMGALVKRDRNHPSVVIWSFCNEAGCEGSHENGGPRFREITYEHDGSRPTLANMFTFGDLLSNTIDVQGFSHQSRDKLNSCHKALPHKPIYMSECCSCNTMRDEDEGCETLHDNPHNACIQKSFNARCAESNAATNASDGVDYAVGTMVWTLFDYYGEPPVGGLEVSSTYGQYDLCGFPKAAAFWYRTQWLLTVPDGPDKTFPTKGKHEVHLVESWESPDAFPSTKGNTTRSIHAYSSAPFVELFVNGKTQGVRSVVPMVKGPGSYAEWTAVPWEAGTLTAVASTVDPSTKKQTKVATTSRHTNGKAAKLDLSLDAPSVLTGTGSAVLLDGHDAALLRASVVDASGTVMQQASHNISFRVVSGPAFIQGAHNGDPHSKDPNDAPWRTAYHGLVRAVVRVTSTAGLAKTAEERALMRAIDGPSGFDHAQAAAATDPIVVEATADGFAPARVTIPVSTDAAAAGVMAVAEAGAGQPVDFFRQ